jgi:hypothetical protein
LQTQWREIYSATPVDPSCDQVAPTPLERGPIHRLLAGRAVSNSYSLIGGLGFGRANFHLPGRSPHGVRASWLGQCFAGGLDLPGAARDKSQITGPFACDPLDALEGFRERSGIRRLDDSRLSARPSGARAWPSVQPRPRRLFTAPERGVNTAAWVYASNRLSILGRQAR